MYKAKTEFVNGLLSDLGYKISMEPNRSGTIQDHVFDWKPSKEARTAAAGEQLASLMTPKSRYVPLRFVPVTVFKLCDVKKRKQT
jgi:hypothetical protein